MSIKFRYFSVIIILVFLAVLFSQQQNGSESLLVNATSSLNIIQKDVVKNKQQETTAIAKAIKNLLDGTPSSMTFVLIERGDKQKCENPDGKCAEITEAKDEGVETTAQSKTQNLKPTDWRTNGKFHIVMVGGQLFAAQLFPKQDKLVLLRTDNTSITDLIQNIQIIDTANNPAFLNEAFISTLPLLLNKNCCKLCWLMNRTFGLPCIADLNCCSKSCGVDPDCLNVEIPHTDSSSNPQCNGTSLVLNAKTDIGGGSTCDFTGEVTKIPASNEECLILATNGVFSNYAFETGGSGQNNIPDLIGHW